MSDIVISKQGGISRLSSQSYMGRVIMIKMCAGKKQRLGSSRFSDHTCFIGAQVSGKSKHCQFHFLK